MNIYQSITDIMAEGYSISKDKKNVQQGFRYRGIDDVMNTFFPLLSKHKVFLVPEVLDCKREERQTTKGGNLIYSMLTVKYTFYADDGSSVSAVVVGEGMDSGDKASNKALAVAMKYAMFQVFCIPTEEMIDPDATTPEPSVPQEKPHNPCANCGKEIVSTPDSNGKMISAARLINSTVEAFGKPLCYECASRAAEMQKEVEARLQSAADKAARAKVE